MKLFKNSNATQISEKFKILITESSYMRITQIYKKFSTKLNDADK